MLASVLFPYDEDAPKMIDGWLSELENEGCLVRYCVGNDDYIQICHWDHQKIDHPQPSKLPQAPEKKSKKTKLSVRECSVKPREPSPVVRAVSSTVPDRIGEDKKVSSAEPKTALALVDDPCLISLPTNVPSKTYNVLQSQFDQFQALYPAVDMAQELRAMAGWLIANPKHAKTMTGMPRFMNAWLSKSQNRSRPNDRTSKNDNWLAGAAALSAELAADR